MRFSLLTFLASLTLLTGCEPDPIDIELPAHEPRLVIASGLASVRDSTLGVFDSALVVVVTRSLSALSGASEQPQDSALVSGQLVPHARVELLGGGQSWTLQSLGGGAYALIDPPLTPGAAYTLFVTDSASGLHCEATTTYLPQIRFDYVKPTVTRADHDTAVVLEYQLTDRPGSSFYMVQYTTQKGMQARLAVAGGGAADPNALLGSLQADLRLLTDNDFTNGRYTLREQIPVGGQDTLLLNVAQVSEDYFRFLQAYRKSGKFFNQITGEPINLPTNVRNGYGFFGLHALHAELIDLSQY